MKFNFEYGKRKFNLDVIVCGDILSQARGLMFKKNSKPLLFVFKTARRIAIHSFFCVPFTAIWFNRNRIIDIKVINSWKFSIRPKEKSDKLLEIPMNDPAFAYFLDDTKGLKRKKTYNN
ncbi:MAG: DUF192 domain-containing protein [Candidatus Nanoarchaeia archaeon]|nr:DUF192 domain-containing protein [Candidatus Nanoarchaeia archaeon]MDD5740821.1 DUF192 domain-containing protein [Candidatus Nanoarchaeia archaeon]